MCLTAVRFSSMFSSYSFDQEGHYLFTAASDSHVFVLNAKPSESFSVIGYTGRHCFQTLLNKRDDSLS